MDRAPWRHEGPETGRKKKVSSTQAEPAAAPPADTAPAAAGEAESPDTEPHAAVENPTDEGPQAQHLATSHPEEAGLSRVDTEAEVIGADADQPVREPDIEAVPQPDKVSVPQLPPPKHNSFGKWSIAAISIAAVIGLILFMVETRDAAIDEDAKTNGFVTVPGAAIVDPRAGKTELPASVRKQLDEAENIRKEVARLRRIELEYQQTLEKAEILQHERDTALAKAQAEEAQRVREAELAKQAAEREQAAAAAAVAAEKALQAEREAEALAEKKRLAEQKRRQEQLRLEREARE